MIKIVSDGKCENTRVYADDGHEIVGVQKIIWCIDAKNFSKRATVILEFPVSQVEVEGDLAPNLVEKSTE